MHKLKIKWTFRKPKITNQDITSNLETWSKHYHDIMFNNYYDF